MNSNKLLPPIPKTEKGFWWIFNTEILGPFTPTELLEQIKKNTLTQESYVYRPGYSNWRKAKDSRELDALWF